MPQPRIDRRLVTLLAIVFAQILAMSMVLPILSLFAINELGTPETQTPLILTSFFAAQFIAAPILGRMSDRFGRVPVLVWSQVGTVVSFLMLALAQDIGMVYASRILDGITGGNILVAQAYLIDITPRERRTQALGLIFAMFGLAFIIGPAIGGALAGVVGRQGVFLIAALITVVPTLMTRFTLDEPLTADQRAANRARGGSFGFGQMLRDRALVNVLILVTFGSLALGVIQTTFAVYGQNILYAGKDEGTVNIGVGLLMAVIGIGQTITQSFLLRRLLRRFGDAPLVLGGSLIRTLALSWYVIVGLPFMLVLVGQDGLPLVVIPAAIGFAMGTGIMLPPLQSLATYAAPDHARGAVVGLTGSAQSLGIILGTLITGPLLGVVIAGRPSLGSFLVTALISALLTFPALALVRRFGAKSAQIASETPTPVAVAASSEVVGD